MQIFKILFPTISNELTPDLKKLILSETLISTCLKLENSSSKKISHMNSKSHFFLKKKI